MIYAIRPLTDALRAAHERKGQSQRTLGHKIGVPQGRLSKIENAAVDLRTSKSPRNRPHPRFGSDADSASAGPGRHSLIRHTERTAKVEEAPRPVYALDEEGDGNG